MKFLHFNQIRHNSTWTIHVRISQKMQQKVKNHLTFKTISTQANFAHMSFTWISPEIHIKWAYTGLESKWISCEIHINLNLYEWNCHVFTTKWSIMHMSKTLANRKEVIQQYHTWLSCSTCLVKKHILFLLEGVNFVIIRNKMGENQAILYYTSIIAFLTVMFNINKTPYHYFSFDFLKAI